MSAGIDYGMGMANVDRATGIRYGVISQHTLAPESLSDLEPVYPETEHDDDCDNHDCCNCGDMSEPMGFAYDQHGYHLESGTDGFGIFVITSPYFTRAQFCSPCAPGAGNLDSPDEDGVKTFCLGADWFDDENPAPYPIYSVATGERVDGVAS